MEQAWFTAALWPILALAVTLLSIWLRIPVGFVATLLGAATVARFFLGWSTSSSWLAGFVRGGRVSELSPGGDRHGERGNPDRNCECLLPAQASASQTR